MYGVNVCCTDDKGEITMKYGIYFAYWEKEWAAEQIRYISKVKKLGFDILEISCAMLKDISDEKLKETVEAEDYKVTSIQ